MWTAPGTALSGWKGIGGSIALAQTHPAKQSPGGEKKLRPQSENPRAHLIRVSSRQSNPEEQGDSESIRLPVKAGPQSAGL